MPGFNRQGPPNGQGNQSGRRLGKCNDANDLENNKGENLEYGRGFGNGAGQGRGAGRGFGNNQQDGRGIGRGQGNGAGMGRRNR